jgi:quinol monooxygenase YgiN
VDAVYARVVSNQIQAGKMDEWLAIVRDSIVPSLKQQAGFNGFVVLVDREHDKSVGYSTWESQSDLVASEADGNYQQQIAKLGAVLAAPPERDPSAEGVGVVAEP